jgi:sugar lactone lactonase YvrE
MAVVTCVAPTGDLCGEAATWDASRNTVYWVDINRFLLHAHDIAQQKTRSHIFDEPVVALSLTDREGTLLVCLGSQLILFDTADGSSTPLGVSLPGSPDVRFNDGRSDPRGAFWVGSMDNNVGPEGQNLDPVDGKGKLFRYRAGGKLEEMESGIGIANTLCWAPDRRSFYFGDTLKNEIRVYPYDLDTGNIGPGKPFFSGFDRGYPDGSAIDAEGYLWNCRFAGGCIVRVAPDGSIDRVIEMPAANVTTCAFGGPDLATLYVTTASIRKADTDRLAGSLFAIETETRGLPENRFANERTRVTWTI